MKLFAWLPLFKTTKSSKFRWGCSQQPLPKICLRLERIEVDTEVNSRSFAAAWSPRHYSTASQFLWPPETLRHDLSVNSVKTTFSNFAKRMNLVSGSAGRDITVIGLGTCGTVSEIPGTDKVLKLGSLGHISLWTPTTLAYRRKAENNAMDTPLL